MGRPRTVGIVNSGDKYHALTAKNIDHTKNYIEYWCFVCDCGNEMVANIYKVLSGGTKSCGCWRKKRMSDSINLLGRKSCGFHDGTCVAFLSAKVRVDNSTGVKGVSYHKQTGKYRAYIRIRNKYINIGYYGNVADAALARKRAEQKYFQPIIEKYGREEVVV